MGSPTVIKVENISKQYRLGNIGTGTLKHDINRLWHRARGLPDPYLKVTESNVRSQAATSEYVWALRDISFDIRQGEILGIIGRNGAGKSTLLKLLSRVTAPTTGQIKIRGRIAALLEVGTGFHPELTGRENIYLNGAIMGMKRWEIRTKMDQILEFSGCERYADTPIKRYSSGMKVRLGFAVAAHLEPEILIIDEVLAVGDIGFQQRCLEKIRQISKTGRTVIFVSHNMDNITSLCSRAILLQDGQRENDGAVDEVAGEYLLRLSGESSIEVANWTDRITSGKARILSIELLDKNGHPSPQLEFDKPWSCRYRIQVNQPLSKVEFRLFIDSQEGNSLVDLRSLHRGFTRDCSPGEYTATVQVPAMHLLPGKYLISPLIMDSRTGEDIDWVRHCLNFRVMSPVTDDSVPHLESKWGRFWVPSEWKIEP